MRALELAGEELEPDASGAQLLGERRQLDAAAEPLVLVHDDRYLPTPITEGWHYFRRRGCAGPG
jgi:hypothetical protein